jgi:hypothetical protein
MQRAGSTLHSTDWPRTARHRLRRRVPRGKSELINAIFFADYGKRILPSSAGRTTMRPTELL